MPIIVGLLVFLLALGIDLTDGYRVHALIRHVQHIAYDMRLHDTISEPADLSTSPIVIVDVDEKSLRLEGHWPWSRDKLADLTRRLLAQGATVVAFDMLFPEDAPNIVQVIADRLLPNTPNHPIISGYLQRILPDYAHDQTFADQLATGDTILGFLLHNQLIQSVGELPPSQLSLVDHMDQQVTLPVMRRYLTSRPILQQAAHGMGFTTILPDVDGVIRRTPLLLRHQDHLYPALALAAVRQYLLVDQIDLHTEPIGNHRMPTSVGLGATQIPVDGLGQMLIPFQGPMHTFVYYSATDVLHDQLPPGALQGKLVFVGASAFGLGDVHTMPFQSSTYPGVEVHANIAHAILSQQFLYTPAWSKGAEIVLLVVVGLLGAVIFPWLAPLWMLGFAVSFWAGLWGISTVLWSRWGWVLPEPVVPIFLVLALVLWNMVYGFLFEGKRRQQLKAMFGRYVPDSHVDAMLASHEQFDVEGKTQEMTVLFADICNFTHLVESLDAVQVKKMLNAVFTPLTKIIFESSGTIDKYIGDMIMAFWGAPLNDAQHARHAVQAALAMQEKITAMQSTWSSLGFVGIQLGIGLNTGLMHVGDMGSEYRLAYTVLGDSVNTASRLEGLTRHYQVGVIITEDTRNAVPDLVCRHLDHVQVKGREAFVDIYQPLCFESEADSALLAALAQHEAGLKAYLQQDWEKAREIFKKLASHFPKGDTDLYGVYLDSMDQFQGKRDVGGGH